jgi:hypothetical protein
VRDDVATEQANPKERDPMTHNVNTRMLPAAALLAIVAALAVVLVSHRDAGAGTGPSIIEHPVIRPAAANADASRPVAAHRPRAQPAPLQDAPAAAAEPAADVPATQQALPTPPVAAPPRRRAVARPRHRPVLRAEVHAGPIATTAPKPNAKAKPRPATPAPKHRQPARTPAQPAAEQSPSPQMSGDPAQPDSPQGGQGSADPHGGGDKGGQPGDG